MDTGKNKNGEKSGEELLDESVQRFKDESRRTVKIEVRPGIVAIKPSPSKP